MRWLVPSEHGDRLLVGEIDLVLHLGDRLVLIDHKSFAGGAEKRDERVHEHAAQLAAYRAALTNATGLVVEGMFLHFPIRGEVVEVCVSGDPGQLPAG